MADGMTPDDYRQLTRLLHKFRSAFVRTKPPPSKAAYVTHAVVTQRLLEVVGPFSFELVELIRGDVDAKPPNPKGESAKARAGSPALTAAVVGVVARLTVEVDGRSVSIEDVGDCEAPHNWPHDGARGKDAMSDALKRCAARVGVGLHLWTKSDDEFYLGPKLVEQDEAKFAARSSDG